MKSELSLALSSPYKLIECYEIDSDFNLIFSNLFSNEQDVLEIELINSNSESGQLVKFRGMIQDSGFGVELYQSISITGQNLMFGNEFNINPIEISNNTSTLKERSTFYITSIPGQSIWYQQLNDNNSNLQTSISNLSLSSSPSTTTPPTNDLKYPVPSEHHFGCMAKVSHFSLTSTNYLD
jgi:hypothetical protein